MLKTNGKYSKTDSTNNGLILSSSSSLLPPLTGPGSGTVLVLADDQGQPVTDNCLFQFYISNFFKVPKDIKNDIIYCQRTLKTHIKIHQMVLDVFQQQPDADPLQKKRILEELESEIYEINAEQQFLILRVRRVIDEFYRSLKGRNIPIDENFTNSIVSKDIVPYINDSSLIITPVNVLLRNTEEKLIEKYFEIQKEPDVIELIDDDGVDEMIDDKERLRKMIKSKEMQKFSNKLPQSVSPLAANLASGESLLLNSNNGMPALISTQKSLLKPMNQRMSIDGIINSAVVNGASSDHDMQPKITGAFSLYNANMPNKNQLTVGNDAGSVMGQSCTDDNVLNSIERPVPASVKMSRLNLRQALKRAQAAARGPPPSMSTASTLTPSSLPPPLAPIQPFATAVPPTKRKLQQQQQHSQQQQQQQQQPPTKALNVHGQIPTTMVSATTSTATSVTGPALLKKSSVAKTKATRNAIAAAAAAAATAPSAAIVIPTPTTATVSDSVNGDGGAAAATSAAAAAGSADVKTPDPTSSSGESSPERELEETRTKAIEYGQEMFLRIFDLFTPQVHAQMQQRRSKRRRRCVQKNERSMYHYGKIEHNVPTANSEIDQNKKKRKAFLLSPQTKKQLPSKRTTKRASADKSGNSGNGGSGSASGNSGVSGRGSRASAGSANSDNASRSNTTSPVEKINSCTVCLKTEGNLEQCTKCQLWYHITCHHDPTTEHVDQFSEKFNATDNNELCPTCKKNLLADYKNESSKNENLLKTIQELELLMAKERDRKEILQRTSKSYKAQMATLYDAVKAIKNYRNDVNHATDNNEVIMLD